MDTIQKIKEYASKHGLDHADIVDSEVTPVTDFNGLDFIDTENFEIPSSFEVDRAVVVNIKTPDEINPEDTGGDAYEQYRASVCELTQTARPQYIAVNGSYVKLMCWCQWTR